MSTTSQKGLFALRPRDHFGTLSPSPLPGITHDSGEELSRLLELNNKNFHIFLNDQGFHNHLTHHLFAAWDFGASPKLLKAAYDLHAPDQRPAFASPGTIDRSNWTEHLGDESFYNAYFKYFAFEINDGLGISKILEEFIFAKEANWIDAPKSPQMLGRFFGGLIHPLIHTGHIEFGVLGMVAEGLAQAAVTQHGTSGLFPIEFFPETSNDDYKATAELVNLTLEDDEKQLRSKQGTHSFELLARMLKDPRLDPGQACERTSTQRFNDVLKNRGDIIRSYISEWVVPLDPLEIKAKIEELSWLSTVIFGLGGWREGHRFRADFFTTHVLTSSLFLPSVAAYLSLPSQSILLRGHLAVALTYWVSRGRPQLPFEEFYSHVSASPTPPISYSKAPNDATLVKEALFENPWLSIVQSCLHHPDEHLLKLQRAILHYSNLYGHKAPGEVLPQEVQTDLPGVERLDGTLFVRVAGLAMEALGWVREGQEPGFYDREGLGWDEVWEKDV